MVLRKLQPLPTSKTSPKEKEQYLLLQELLLELEQKEVPEDIIEDLNKELDKINFSLNSGETIKTRLYKGRSRILELLEKKLELVPKNHYRNRWLALGIAAFGIPLGTVFSITLDNFAFISIGFPFGLALGLSIGTSLDKKAQENGKQLDFENK